MPLTTQALTTIQTARDYTRAHDDDAKTKVLELLINSYSQAIHRYTERQFLPKDPADDTDDPVARTFRYDGRGVLTHRKLELRPVDIGDIVLYSDLPAEDQVTVAAGDYRLEPVSLTDEGTYLWLTLPELDLTGTAERLGVEVSVTGRWGAGTVPADAELACLIAVANGFRNPEAFQSRDLGALAFSEVAQDPDEAGRSLPPDARALLAPMRRKTLT